MQEQLRRVSVCPLCVVSRDGTLGRLSPAGFVRDDLCMNICYYEVDGLVCLSAWGATNGRVRNCHSVMTHAVSNACEQ
jgi:hypothetical protein